MQDEIQNICENNYYINHLQNIYTTYTEHAMLASYRIEYLKYINE